MPNAPSLWMPDHTLPLLANPYHFISETARRLGTDAFETRLLLRRTICMTGPEAAAVFYDPARFQRSGAAPGRLEKTLFGQGGVQGLDGEEHQHRKQVFLDIITPEATGDLAATVTRYWSVYAERWAQAGQVELYPQIQELLTRAVCEWAGVALAEDEVSERTRQLTALFDDAGAIGPRHWRSRVARKSADRWARALIASIRAGELQPPPASTAYRIARHTASDGTPLPAQIAAVELLNVLRPTIAVSVYVTFVAHALAEHPEWRQRLTAGDGAEDMLFVQEVRRHYPFFPAVAAVVREDFLWGGQRFAKGQRVLFDLYGTNHDPRGWDRPDRFDPTRFDGWDGDPYTFVPQGGGDRETDHRCPGEPLAMSLMTVAVEQLCRRQSYTIDSSPPLDDKRLPALPHGLVIRRAP